MHLQKTLFAAEINCYTKVSKILYATNGEKLLQVKHV